jgi:hypothetical protein
LTIYYVATLALGSSPRLRVIANGKTKTQGELKTIKKIESKVKGSIPMTLKINFHFGNHHPSKV